MSVYPVFEITSIKNRFTVDLNKFLNNCNEKTPGKYNIETEQATYSNLLFEYSNDKDSMISNLVPIMNKFSDLIGSSHTFADFNYSHDISTYDINKQEAIWMTRHALFYQLLICTTLCMNNIDTYNSVYGIESLFRDDIVNELYNFKIGIFGSLTPTSDIDIGIQYSGATLKVPGLAYVVSNFERLFMILLGGKNSLSFDIETYADMMTMPSRKQGDNGIDYFYLDSSKFEYNHYTKLLPYACASIIRNYKTAVPLDQTPITFDTIKNIDDTNLAASFNSIENIINQFAKTNITTISKDINQGFMIGQKLVDEYMNLPYETAINQYYKLVDAAETRKFELTFRSDIKLNIDGNVEFSSDEIVELMQLIGNALIYRAESYICAPTVVHVVRILQAGDKSNKYDTIKPKEYCATHISDPFCTIGPFGFIFSMFEQLGYVYRFYLTYCKATPINEEKCKKKKEKYMSRFTNALFYLDKYKDVPSIWDKIISNISKRRESNVLGGKSKRRKTKRSKTRRSKKRRSIRRNLR